MNERDREREKERVASFQIRLCIWYPLIVYETNLHVSLLFIQGYTSTEDNRILYSLLVLFFFLFVIFVKKKRETDKHGVRGSKEQGPGNNIQEKREQVQ